MNDLDNEALQRALSEDAEWGMSGHAETIRAALEECLADHGEGMPKEIWCLPFDKETPIGNERDGGYCIRREGYLPEQTPTRYVRADLPSSAPVLPAGMDELREIIASGWHGWFGDEDPDGDRENVYMIPLDQFERLEQLLAAHPSPQPSGEVGDGDE